MAGMRFVLKDDVFMGKIVFSNQLLNVHREDKHIYNLEWRLTFSLLISVMAFHLLTQK